MKLLVDIAVGSSLMGKSIGEEKLEEIESNNYHCSNKCDIPKKSGDKLEVDIMTLLASVDALA